MLFEGAKCYRRDGAYLGIAKAIPTTDGYSWQVGTSRYNAEGKSIAGRFYDAVRAEGKNGEVRATLVDPAEAEPEAKPEPAARILALAVGGYYRTRAGEIVGPLELDESTRFTYWPFRYHLRSWTPGGRYSVDSRNGFPDDPNDLVEFIGMDPPEPKPEPEPEPEPEAEAAPEPDAQAERKPEPPAKSVTKHYAGTFGLWTPFGSITASADGFVGENATAITIRAVSLHGQPVPPQALDKWAVFRGGEWVTLRVLLQAAFLEECVL